MKLVAPVRGIDRAGRRLGRSAEAEGEIGESRRMAVYPETHHAEQ